MSMTEGIDIMILSQLTLCSKERDHLQRLCSILIDFGKSRAISIKLPRETSFATWATKTLPSARSIVLEGKESFIGFHYENFFKSVRIQVFVP